jgi:protein SCO1/2
MMKSRRTVLVFFIVCAVITLAATAVLLKQRDSMAAMVTTQPPAASPLEVYWPAPDFTLSGANSEPFASATLKGQVWIADFFFTSCPAICPTMTAEMKALYDEFAEAYDVRFVSISVDPIRDTTEKLAEYAKRFGADPARWHFLRGDFEVVQELSVKGFKLGLDGPTGHSSRFVLVDTQGNVRGNYDSLDRDALANLRRDLHTLL